MPEGGGGKAIHLAWALETGLLQRTGLPLSLPDRLLMNSRASGLSCAASLGLAVSAADAICPRPKSGAMEVLAVGAAMVLSVSVVWMSSSSGRPASLAYAMLAAPCRSSFHARPVCRECALLCFEHFPFHWPLGCWVDA